MLRTFLLLLTCNALVSAKLLVSPIEAMEENFPDTLISKKNIILSKKDALKVQKEAHTKLRTKIYRIFYAKKDGKVVGYGILVNQKVRSKNSVILYSIQNGTLVDVTIIAFNEPLEYIPGKEWSKQFEGTKTTQMLQLNREIPTLTGATLSARSVTQASRIAFAIYNTLLKEK